VVIAIVGVLMGRVIGNPILADIFKPLKSFTPDEFTNNGFLDFESSVKGLKGLAKEE
jgi:hypothetical protein